jgi:hypothetical protein
VGRFVRVDLASRFHRSANDWLHAGLARSGITLARTRPPRSSIQDRPNLPISVKPLPPRAALRLLTIQVSAPVRAIDSTLRFPHRPLNGHARNRVIFRYTPITSTQAVSDSPLSHGRSVSAGHGCKQTNNVQNEPNRDCPNEPIFARKASKIKQMSSPKRTHRGPFQAIATPNCGVAKPLKTSPKSARKRCIMLQSPGGKAICVEL